MFHVEQNPFQRRRGPVVAGITLWQYTPAMLPQSLISVDVQNRSCVVCAWCDDTEAGAQWAKEQELAMTNNRCEKCTQRFKAELKCERASRQPFPPAVE